MQNFDLLIIGGGINGTGIAADAAGRGLTVAVCEMGDLASGTSSSSTKLIHGGLRYLEQYAFGMVRHSLQESQYLFENAPHLLTPQSFILPHNPDIRPAWLIKLGLFLYDNLARCRKLPSSQTLPAKLIPTLGLKKNYQHCFQYYDYWVDDSRLVCHLALQAQNHQAKIFTYTKIIAAEREQGSWKCTLQNQLSEETFTITAKAVINASGPWVQSIANQTFNILTEHSVQLVKGSHIIVPRIFNHSHAFILQNCDKRIVFIIPYQEKFHLIGTTDVPIDSPESDNYVSKAEIEYLLNTVNPFIPKPISMEDIIHSYWGIRALQADNHQQASAVTRDFAIDVHHENTFYPFISIFGGKLTTYRYLSEQVVSKLRPFFPDLKPSWTQKSPLPGNPFPCSMEDFSTTLFSRYPFLETELLKQYLQNYGSRTELLLQNVSSLQDLGILFGGNLYQLEVDFLLKTEWAKTAEDILWRRGKQGLFLTLAQQQNLQTYIANRLK